MEVVWGNITKKKDHKRPKNLALGTKTIEFDDWQFLNSNIENIVFVDILSKVALVLDVGECSILDYSHGVLISYLFFKCSMLKFSS